MIGQIQEYISAVVLLCKGEEPVDPVVTHCVQQRELQMCCKMHSTGTIIEKMVEVDWSCHQAREGIHLEDCPLLDT